eukprot:TRINITY_DN3362_c0_g1_i6.p1 TRINITY_DN3362_c0_g1~~TRINITY_DN3362_c0_g1_i6.p1  ORF type:complete len:662 (-),score=171.03 TRINITY_DN3362_c0_g1_i6:1252-3135(-)
MIEPSPEEGQEDATADGQAEAAEGDDADIATNDYVVVEPAGVDSVGNPGRASVNGGASMVDDDDDDDDSDSSESDVEPQPAPLSPSSQPPMTSPGLRSSQVSAVQAMFNAALFVPLSTGVNAGASVGATASSMTEEERQRRQDRRARRRAEKGAAKKKSIWSTTNRRLQKYMLRLQIILFALLDSRNELLRLLPPHSLDLEIASESEMFNAIQRFFLFNTKRFIGCAIILGLVTTPSLTSTIYAILWFLVFLVAKHDALPSRWRLLMGYTSLVIVAKFVFQSAIFCFCYADTRLDYSLEPSCSAIECRINVDELEERRDLEAPYLVGIYKFSGLFVSEAAWDITILFLALLYRSIMADSGAWDLVELLAVEKALMEERVKEQQEQLERAEQERRRAEEETGKARRRGKGKEGQQRGGENRVQMGLNTIILTQFPTPDELVAHRPQKLRELSLLAALSELPQRMKKYWSSLENDSEVDLTGKDYYKEIFFSEMLCFFVIVVFYPDFTDSSENQVSAIMGDDVISGKYVLVLVAQFSLILLDRVLYLTRSLRWKMVLHVCQVFVIHGMLIFYLPVSTDRPFSNNISLVALYLLKGVSLALSGLQVSASYPPFISGQYLTRSYTETRRIV